MDWWMQNFLKQYSINPYYTIRYQAIQKLCRKLK
jgi:hypothetical protein